MEQDVLRAFEKKCIQEEPAYCTAACPFHMDVKSFLGYMAKKEVDKGFKIIEQRIPLPEIVARICDHPCENQCIRKNLDTPLSIGTLERACAAGRSKQKKRFVLPAKEKKVGIWGSGLSSLTAAWDLGLKGYEVTIFDPAQILGGNLLKLPVALLPATLLAREIKTLETYGVCFQTQIVPDSAFWAKQLKFFDAIYLGFDSPADPYPHLAYDENGNPRVDSFTLQTSNPKIFAGGFSDKGVVNYQQSYPIGFAAQGRKAATTIDRVLTGVSVSAGREKEGVCPTRLTTDISRIKAQVPIDLRQDPKDIRAGYDLEKAGQEAARCIQCDCSRCVRVCTYIDSFKKFPGKYAREIYNNSAIVMGERKANLLINSCSLCSLCQEVCPHDFSMADLCLSARQEMVESGKMPVSAHEFALQEMEFASGDACWFARHEPGSDASDQIFFPGCQLLGSAPSQVEKVYDFLRKQLPGNTGFVSGCCGAPGVWAGQKALARESIAKFKGFWEASGKPCIITACTACTTMLTQALEQATIISLFQVMATDPLTGRLPDPVNRVKNRLTDAVNIIDPCTARDDTLVQTAVRTLAKSANIELYELSASKELTECCGFGGLVFTANPQLSKNILSQRAAQSDQDYLAYCAMCRDRLASTGKKVVHILDFFWPSTDHPEQKKDPGFSLRHDNLARAKQEMLARVWKETNRLQKSNSQALTSQELKNQAPLVISPGVAQVLEDQFILRADIQKVIDRFESGDNYFVYPENNSIICFYRPVRVCFWVEFRQTAQGMEILNAWCHRMEVIANTLFVEDAPTHDADEQLVCHACDTPLTHYKNHVKYLGSQFDVALPQCDQCGIVYVSQGLAQGKMAEVEKILEDK